MLFANTAGNLVLNVATTVFNFGITLALSRLLGARGYGAYAFATAFAVLLGIPAQLGLAALVVREVAAYRVTESWSHIRGLLRRGNQAVIVASTIACGGALAVSLGFAWPSGELFRPMLLALPLVPLTAVVMLRQNAILGFGRVVVARIPETVAGPGMILVFVLGLGAALDDRFTATWAVGANVAAMGLAALLGVAMLRRTLPSGARTHRPVFETRRWAVAAVPLVLFSVVAALNVQLGTVLVGALGGAREAGIYSVANRAGGLVVFVLLGTTPALMPVIAELHARGEAGGLQSLLSRSAGYVLLGSLPVALGVVVFAEPVLQLFGLEFGEGATALRVIAVGQLVNVAFGFPGTALVMTGHAGQLTWCVAAGACANLALSVALIPPLGAEGAAIATAVSVAGTNALMAAVLWRRHRLFSLALPRR